MRNRKARLVLAAPFAVAVMMIAAPPAPAAGRELILHSFTSDPDGSTPWDNLIFDGAGNLYGTTIAGGAYNVGTAFELTPQQDGSWTETILHSFQENYADANQPVAGLIFDGAGNLYGTTIAGGAHSYGTVFMLTPDGHGKWTETILHSFTGSRDGSELYGSLIIDAAGNLYGMSAGLGIRGNQGNVFKLAPPTDKSKDKWVLTVLHTFKGSDGWSPRAGLVIDSAGNLYGTTTLGGKEGGGNVFELIPAQDGSWNEKVLHVFRYRHGDGNDPDASLVLDSAGNLYGTTFAGGMAGCEFGCGVVFELSPPPGNTSSRWTETILYKFTGGADGGNPVAGLILSGGDLYGTTLFGGVFGQFCGSGCGTVFRLAPGVGGWDESVLFSFENPDGAFPNAAPVFDAAGNLYGTTLNGGSDRVDGVVFELKNQH
ncbi:MAG TPA: choice-of-anchor tandem repeat GloVer-containing protein [Rhizomicrobium sp.]